MHENELSKIIVNTCYKIHTKLGPGLLESVYETILLHELNNTGLRIEQQRSIYGTTSKWNIVLEQTSLLSH
ncbi:MAG: GxxExxY protein [Bacteroidales bacterium]|nr:GxxExxY protein [Bacteroidales bacterium]